MRVDTGGAAAAIAGATIGGATLLRVARRFPLRNRTGTSAVTLAPASLLPAAVAELVLVAGRRWTAAAAGAVVLAGCATVHVPPFRRTAASAARRRRSDLRLTVMTVMTVMHGHADVEALAGTVRQHEVAVLCVQEVHRSALDAIADRLPHRHDRPGADGAGSGRPVWTCAPRDSRAATTGPSSP